MSISLWVSIVAILISGMAAFFSYRSAHTASLPLLAMWLVGDSHRQFRYMIANKGNGAAIIESVVFFVDGEKIDVPMEHAIRAGFRELLSRSEVKDFIKIERVMSFSRGRPLGGNEERDMVQFSIDEDRFNFNHKKQSEIFSRMEIQIIYKDVFDDARVTIFKRDSVRTEYSDPPIRMPSFKWARRVVSQFKGIDNF